MRKLRSTHILIKLKKYEKPPSGYFHRLSLRISEIVETVDISNEPPLDQLSVDVDDSVSSKPPEQLAE